MKHPEREEWVPFIFNEAEPQTRARLAQHLKDCAECAREVAGWRRSLRRLDRWPLPKPEPMPTPLFQPFLKWALAAALVLGTGMLIGRVTAPPRPPLSELRAAIEASVRSSLEADMTQAFRQLQDQTSSALVSAEARLAKGSAVERQRFWRDLLDVLAAARTDDAGALQAALRTAQERNETEFVALRKDLETLASMTDEEIRDARLRLVQLAAVRDSTQ
jgi:hypothetical protein